MNIVNLTKDDARSVWGIPCKYKKGTLEDGASSDAIIGFNGISNIFVYITKGTCYYTIDSYAEIEADTAVWLPWTYGEVSVPTLGICVPGGLTGIYFTGIAQETVTWGISG